MRLKPLIHILWILEAFSVVRLRNAGTITGYILVGITLVYIVLGIDNLVKEKQEKKLYETTIDSLNKNVEYLKGTNNSFYILLTSLGYKIDTTKREAKRNSDSLINIITGQSKQLRASNGNLTDTKAYLDLCLKTENLLIKERDDGTLLINVDVCNSKTVIYNLRIKYTPIFKGEKFIMATTGTRYVYNLDGPLPSDAILSAGIILTKYNPTDTIYVYFNCTYQDEKKKKYGFKRVFRAFPKATVFSFVNEDKAVYIKEFLKQKKVW